MKIKSQSPIWLSSAALVALSCQSHAPVEPAASPAPVAAPASVPAKALAAAQPELGSFGVDLTARDTSVNPGDDFYDFANGGWQKSYQLKADEMRYGAFVALSYRAEDQVRGIIQELGNQTPAPATPAQQVADYFASFMDVASANAKGITPLEPELAAIQAIKTQADLVAAFGRAELVGTAAPIALSVGLDRQDPERHELNVAHAGLGMPARDYYLAESFAETRKAYEANIARLLGFTQLSQAEAAGAAKAVLALETEIAKHHWSMAELRQRDKTLNPATLASLEKDVPGYDWKRHLQAQGVDAATLGKINVTTPNALAPLALVIKRTQLQTWRHYLSYHLIKNHAMLLGEAIDNAAFEFFGKVLNGQPQQRERWKRAVQLVGSHEALGEALGKLYVERYFPPESKRQMDAMLDNLRSALRQRLEQLDWMSDTTKREALAKLESFKPKVGYPKKWRDLSSVVIAKDNLFDNYRAVKKYWYEDTLARLKRPTDKDEWFMTPQTVNAYYNPVFNEIVFPAAILQPPFFDPNADPAVNYGAIGAVIGHEMGHGFDDQGSKSDATGVQRNWWTDADRAQFEARTQRLVVQYDGYEPLEGHKLNGRLTLGENIGDLGGISMAYHAYQLSLAGEQAPVVEGFTGDQRFFLAWAQLWRSKSRDEFMVRVLKSDPHSPGRYRVNGIVRNLDAWYTAFNVGPKSLLYLPPEERVKIW